jgi:DNA-damage-inducible protein J
VHKIATVNARIEPKLKHQAEHILHKVGLSSAEAVRLFYKQICLHKGLPFEVRVPNEETLNAMDEADKRRTKKIKNLDDLFK